MGAILDAASTVLCPHGGTAVAGSSTARVLIAGVPAVVQSDPLVVTGCPHVGAAGPAPCTAVRFVTGASRVRIDGAAVALTDSAARCEPSGLLAVIAAAQTRVTAI